MLITKVMEPLVLARGATAAVVYYPDQPMILRSVRFGVSRERARGVAAWVLRRARQIGRRCRARWWQRWREWARCRLESRISLVAFEIGDTDLIMTEIPVEVWERLPPQPITVRRGEMIAVRVVNRGRGAHISPLLIVEVP